ncbi:MAG: ABC transporter ATP-binding protein [Archaeoglobales archaeon]|nr:ABC transporter ATP-binding protein [Archaeoglobales archaeon]
MLLEVKELKFTYRKKLVFCLVNLILNESEVLVLLGPNGCGKSTLLKCINKILKPYKVIDFVLLGRTPYIGIFYGVEVELLSTNGFRFVVPKVVK